MKRVLMLALALAMTAAAHAADNGFYVGAGIGSSKFGVEGATDDTDMGAKAIVGVRLLDSFALEASYADFGEATLYEDTACTAQAGVPCIAGAKVKGDALGLFALGFLHFPLVDIFAKAGLAKVESSLRSPDGLIEESDKSTDVAWGFGAQAHFGSFALRGEFEQYQLFDKDQRLLSLSFIYTFL